MTDTDTKLPRVRWVHVTEDGEEENYLSELVGYPVLRVTVIAATDKYVDEVTTTHDRDGISRPPPGRGWIAECAKPKPGQTRWQRRRSIP